MFMPRMRTIGRVHTALWEARLAWAQPHMYVEYMHEQPYKDGYDNVTHQYKLAREQFLASDCDAFLSIEDDIIIPKDGIIMLARANMDVAFGIYCLRQKPNLRWNAFVTVSEDEGLSITEHSYLETVQYCNNNSIIEMKGVGLGFTMIKRHVLEKIPFRRDGVACNDWFFSLDCQTHGIKQHAHFGVRCGHVHQVSTRKILWPDQHADNFHREELI
jgi:hypothetical protein